jgi:hypothetical protein
MIMLAFDHPLPANAPAVSGLIVLSGEEAVDHIEDGAALVIGEKGGLAGDLIDHHIMFPVRREKAGTDKNFIRRDFEGLRQSIAELPSRAAGAIDDSGDRISGNRCPSGKFCLAP